MNYILHDRYPRNFYPLTLTRPISELRLGALTLAEKWTRWLRVKNVFYTCENQLQDKFPKHVELDNVVIDSCLLPNKLVAQTILNLLDNQAVMLGDKVVAMRVSGDKIKDKALPIHLNELTNEETTFLVLPDDTAYLEKLTQLFTNCGDYLTEDFAFITKGRKFETPHQSNLLIGEKVFIRKGAKVKGCILNSETGPIYIDKGAEVMEGCTLRGPLYIGKGTVLKMGAKVYGPSSFGPECRVGGEVSNSVFQGYSNKGHDGFLGNSILGEWCNLGADTNTSNLKNNYGNVKRYSYDNRTFTDSGLQFCGLIMGDHSKSAINTQFNTGTTVGVFANVFYSTFPPKYIPCFSWNGDDQQSEYDFEKALELAETVMSRRHVKLTEPDVKILRNIFDRKI